MLRIEVVGLDPPCVKCTELLENVKAAVKKTGIKAEVEKKWALSEEILDKYGMLLSPALVVEGVVVTQGRSLTAERIAELLHG